MGTGLLALLDDVAALVKLSAASLDDIPTQLAQTSAKVSGIVIDDTAVTPKYVVGLSPARELTIIFQIAKWSAINKVCFLGPAALLLGYFAPWLIQPVLMVGGCYLCFEGYEKLHSMLAHGEDAGEAENMQAVTPMALEKMRIKSAVQTDFILSGEIIAITYSTVADKPLFEQALVLFCIAIGITAAVYGVVGLIVKADDIGVHMARKSRYKIVKKAGRKLVQAMPGFLKILGTIGTAAMLWVGAEIIAHGIAPLHHGLAVIEVYFAMPALAWAAKACICAVGGLLVGAVIGQLVHIYAFVSKHGA